MHDLSCDEAGAVRGKKDDDVSDVRGLGHSAEWDKPRLLKQIGLAELIARLRCVGETRRDSIDANTMRGKCQRHGAGEANNTRLAGRVVDTKDMAAHGRGREIDDGTLPTARHHAARERLSDDETPFEIDVVDGIPLRLPQLQERRTRKDPGIVDECVEASEPRISLLDDAMRLAAGGNAAMHKHSPASKGPNIGRRCLGARLVVEPVDGNIGAGASEREGARPPDALLGAGNQSAPSFEVRLHPIAPGLGFAMTWSRARRSAWVSVRPSGSPMRNGEIPRACHPSERPA